MSAQGLKLRALEGSRRPRSARIVVHSPTIGVAIVEAQLGASSAAAPLHWRAGDWTKPPLDISLGLDGRIVTVQAVFQDEVVPRFDWAAAASRPFGAPMFVVDPWPQDRYLDVRAEVRPFHLESGELLVCLGELQQPERLLNLGCGIDLGLDVDERISQIVIGPLSTDDWQLLDHPTPYG